MHILVAVMILVGLDVVIIAFYLLILGVKGDLEAALIPSREKPMELIGVSYDYANDRLHFEITKCKVNTPQHICLKLFQEK